MADTPHTTAKWAKLPHTTIRLSDEGHVRLDWLRQFYPTQTAVIEQALEVLHAKHARPQSTAADDVLSTTERHLALALSTIRGEMARRVDDE